jgi:uncharacterized protein YuzE
VKLTYDSEADSAYVNLVEDIEHGNAIKQVVCRDDAFPQPIVIDLDAEGHVLGLAFRDASAMLPARLLDRYR